MIYQTKLIRIEHLPVLGHSDFIIFNYYDQSRFKMLPTNYLFTNHTHPHTYIYIYIYIKQDLALNNLQGLICHKQNQLPHIRTRVCVMQLCLMNMRVQNNSPMKIAVISTVTCKKNIEI